MHFSSIACVLHAPPISSCLIRSQSKQLADELYTLRSVCASNEVWSRVERERERVRKSSCTSCFVLCVYTSVGVQYWERWIQGKLGYIKTKVEAGPEPLVCSAADSWGTWVRRLRLDLYLHSTIRLHGLVLSQVQDTSSWCGSLLRTVYIFVTWYLSKHRINLRCVVHN
jgi:hypothetical protein